MKLLLVRLSSLGDIILTTSLIDALRKQHSVDLVVYEKFSSVAPLLCGLGRVFFFPKKRIGRFFLRFRFCKAWRLMHDFVKKLRSEKYDYIIDLHNVTDSSLIALLAKGGRRVGNRRQLLSLFFGTRCHIDDLNQSAKQHAAITNLQYGVAAGCLSGTALPLFPRSCLSLSQRAIEYANSFFVDNNLEKLPVVGINPTASYPYKRWPAEYFASVADYLVTHFGCRIIVFSDESGRAVVDAMIAAMDRPAVSVVGSQLEEAAAIAKKCAMLITNDSGMMHVAAAFDLPQVAIFGDANFMKFFPLSNKAESVRPVSIRRKPLLRSKKGLAAGYFFKGITVEKVVAACLRVMGREQFPWCCGCQQGKEKS